MIKEGKIYSSEGRNVLRGTRRDYIFTLARQIGIECIEKNIEPYDVYSADEAFVTGTPFCIMPVSSFQFKKLGNNFGEITKMLLNQWSENVGLDIKEQIIKFNQSFAPGLESSTPYQHISKEK